MEPLLARLSGLPGLAGRSSKRMGTMTALWSACWLLVPSGLLQACSTKGFTSPVLLGAAGVPGCKILLDTLRAESLAGS